MKKIILTVAAVIALSTSAFAEGITFGGSGTVASDVLYRGVSDTNQGAGGIVDMKVGYDVEVVEVYAGVNAQSTSSNPSMTYALGLKKDFGTVGAVVEYQVHDQQDTSDHGGTDLTDANFESVLTKVDVDVSDVNIFVSGNFVTEENKNHNYHTEDRYGVGAEYSFEAGLPLTVSVQGYDQEKWGTNYVASIDAEVAKNVTLGVSYNDMNIDHDTQSGLIEDEETVVESLNYSF